MNFRTQAICMAHTRTNTVTSSMNKKPTVSFSDAILSYIEHDIVRKYGFSNFNSGLIRNYGRIKKVLFQIKDIVFDITINIYRGNLGAGRFIIDTYSATSGRPIHSLSFVIYTKDFVTNGKGLCIPSHRVIEYMTDFYSDLDAHIMQSESKSLHTMK